MIGKGKDILGLCFSNCYYIVLGNLVFMSSGGFHLKLSNTLTDVNFPSGLLRTLCNFYENCFEL